MRDVIHKVYRTVLFETKFISVQWQGDNDKKNFERLTDAIKESRKGKTLGIFSKDSKLSGAFLDAWRAHLSKSKFEQLDVNNAVAFVMAARDESEINTVKKACQVRFNLQWTTQSGFEVLQTRRKRKIRCANYKLSPLNGSK